MNDGNGAARMTTNSGELKEKERYKFAVFKWKF